MVYMALQSSECVFQASLSVQMVKGFSLPQGNSFRYSMSQFGVDVLEGILIHSNANLAHLLWVFSMETNLGAENRARGNLFTLTLATSLESLKSNVLCQMQLMWYCINFDGKLVLTHHVVHKIFQDWNDISKGEYLFCSG